MRAGIGSPHRAIEIGLRVGVVRISSAPATLHRDTRIDRRKPLHPPSAPASIFQRTVGVSADVPRYRRSGTYGYFRIAAARPKNGSDKKWTPHMGGIMDEGSRYSREGEPGVMLSPASPPGDRSARYLNRISVRSVNRIVIVQVASIIRLEAEDNYVRIWADRLYLHKDTLTGLVAELDPAMFLRVHRSHAVNLQLVRELRPQLHGEYSIVLSDGTEITSGRSYRNAIQAVFGLCRQDTD